MRVLIFSTAYYPFVGGAEVAIKEITDRAKDIEFDMVTARFDSKLPAFERIGNVNVYRVGFGCKHFDKWWLMKWGGWKARSLHKKNHYDVSWSMMASWGGLAAWWFKVLCPSVPFVLTLQEGDDIAVRKHGLVAGGWKLILKKVDHLTVISNYLGAEAQKYGYKREVTLVPNGVETKRFKIQNEKLKNDDTILITTSRLVEKNAVGDIISALTLLPENVKLLVAGMGDLESNLKTQVKNLKLEDRVKFLGFVPQEKLPELLHASDIFIRPSLSEGMGISFLEAMAAGLPVIATNVGGIPDFLVDGQTGLFCAVKNPKSIAEQVQKLVSEQDLKSRIVDQAERLVKEKYDWDLIAPKMKEVFDKVASR